MKNPLRLLPCICAALLLAPPAFAADRVWEGPAFLWTNRLNWSGDVAPTAFDNALFNNPVTGPTVPYVVTMDAGPSLGQTIASIFFGSNAGPYIIRQNDDPRTLTLSNLNNNSAYDQLIDGSKLTVGLSKNASIGANSFAVNGAGDLTIAAAGGGIDLGNKHLVLTGTGTGLGTISSAIVGITPGAQQITVNGSATWVLSGNNTHVGPTKLSGGVLSVATIGNVGEASNLGAALASNLAESLVFDGGTLRYTGISDSTNRNFTINDFKTATIEVIGVADLTLSGNATINTAASLTKTGAGTLTLTGSNTGSLLTTISSGRLQIGNGGTTGSVTGPVILGVNGLLIFDRSDSVTYAGSLLGTGTGTNGVTNNGSSLILTGDSTYTGGLFNNGGKLQIGDGGTTGSFAGNIFNLGQLVFNRSNDSTYGGLLSGSGSVTKTGTGTLTLTGNNTFTSQTILSGGVLSVGKIGNAGEASNLGAAHASNPASNLVFNGGTLRYTGLSTLTDRNFTINAGQTATIDVTHAASTLVLFGASAATNGSLTKTGAGALALLGTNLYTGVTKLGGGILYVDTIGNGGIAGGLGKASNAAGNLVFDGGTLGYTGGTAATNRSFTISAGKVAGFEVVNSFANLTLSGNSAPTTGGLAKTGAGTLTISGNHGYIGATSVNAGKLVVNGSLGNTAVTVASGATLGGKGTIGGLVSMLSGSHLAAGNSPGMMTFMSGLSFGTGAIIDFELGTSSDLFRISGGLLSGPAGLGGITLNLVDVGGFNPFTGGTFTLFDYTGATLNNFDTGDFTFGTLLAGTSLSNYSFAFSGSKLLLAITGTGTPGSSVPDSGSSAALFAVAVLGLAAGRRRIRAAQG